MTKPRKRRNREGSIQPLPDGRFKAVFTVAYDPATKKVTRTTETCDTREDAEAALLRMRYEHSLGAPVVDAAQPTEHYLARWLEDRSRPQVTHHTYVGYRNALRTAYPLIGRVPLRDLRPGHLQQMYATLGQRYAPASLAALAAVLHHALDGAVEWDLIAKNPANHAHPPKLRKVTRPHLTPEQARRLISAAPPRWAPLWELLAFTGLRLGEALALQRDDVRPDVLMVRQGKTENARRSVPLTAPVRRALKIQDGQQDFFRKVNRDIWQESGLVFTMEDGRPIRQGSAWRPWKQSLAAAGLPDMRIHDLRHTAVAWLREAGVEVDVAQVIIGHASVKTTLDVYGRVNRQRITEAGRLLETYVEGA